ncbi:hypothetical protein [Janthinobacterium sp. GW458P]|uniref:hypothetical protein n=1 Tax=Janthinobacterium sp. GW458P TaxID=1981504 RepID=UPI0012FD3A00|nr:hypothetical protein [Janthinobacterium sp. GW458P]
MQITFTGRINKLDHAPGGGYRDGVFALGNISKSLTQRNRGELSDSIHLSH